MNRPVYSTVLVMALATTAHADRRLFTSTYEYKTVPQGRTALEIWHTEARHTWNPDTDQSLEEIIEVEHGLTDHWDAALYTVFTELSSNDAMTAQPFLLHEMKVETRYRFADRGELPVDVLAYGEVAKEFGASVYEIEGKVIAARDFDRVTATANVIAAVEVGHDVPETELEVGWAAGVTYEVHPKVNLGVETFGAVEEEEVTAAIGPALAIAPSSNLWVTFTAGFGITDEADKLSGRLIVGVEL